MHLHNVETVVKILAKGALLHHFRQVPVRGADQPDIYVNGPAAAQALKAALLQNAKQLRLQPQVNVADFIQKQRALVRGFQPSAPHG